MNPRPLEIYLVRVEFNGCTDKRPCVVLYTPTAGEISVALISSQPDLYNPLFDFWIEPWHSDFGDTGLTKRSYVVCEREYRLEIQDFVEYLGELTGDLAREFKDCYGL